MHGELSKLDEARLFKLGGATLTLGGLVTGLVILVVACALSWVATRAIRRLRLRAGRAAQPSICWSG